MTLLITGLIVTSPFYVPVLGMWVYDKFSYKGN